MSDGWEELEMEPAARGMLQELHDEVERLREDKAKMAAQWYRDITELKADLAAHERGEVIVRLRLRTTELEAENKHLRIEHLAQEGQLLERITELEAEVERWSKAALQADREVERLRRSLDQKNLHEAALNNTIARLRKQSEDEYAERLKVAAEYADMKAQLGALKAVSGLDIHTLSVTPEQARAAREEEA